MVCSPGGSPEGKGGGSRKGAQMSKGSKIENGPSFCCHFELLTYWGPEKAPPPKKKPTQSGGRLSLIFPICSADLLGFWILLICLQFADLILVGEEFMFPVQIDSIKCFYYLPKGASGVPWGRLSSADQAFLREKPRDVVESQAICVFALHGPMHSWHAFSTQSAALPCGTSAQYTPIAESSGATSSATPSAAPSFGALASPVESVPHLSSFGTLARGLAPANV